MCDYTGRHFGAAYIDAACHEGHLYDLDGDGPSDEFNPCPACNTEAYLDAAAEDAESTAWGRAMTVLYSGCMIIERALTLAERVAPERAMRWRENKGTVSTFDWPERDAVLSGRASPETIREIEMRL